MPPQNLHHSPAAVFGLSLSVLVAWSVGYEAWNGPKAAAEARTGEVAAPAMAASLRVPEAPVAALALELPESRPAPRLRLPHTEEAPPGFEIALQDREGHSLRRFHQALGRAARGEGQARILVYGASHTASDLYTGLLRRELQGAYGDAGHGFILPVKPWPSYRHRDVEIESGGEWESFRVRQPVDQPDYYGLAGVAVESSEPGAFGTVRTQARGDIGTRVSSFDIYYLERAGGGDFDVFIDGERVQRVRTGGNLTLPGFAAFEVPDGPHELQIRVVGNGPVRLFGVALGRNEPGVVVDTLGINGARARYHLFWDDAVYREHLRRRAPDLVALAYGTNESGDNQPIEDYMAELDQVLARIRETVPEASCLLIGPSDRPIQTGRRSYEDRPRTALINDAQWRVALRHGCAFFDTVAFQGGAMSMVSWYAMDPPLAAKDHIHFTYQGYTRMGEVLLGSLIETFEPPAGSPDLRVVPDLGVVPELVQAAR